MRGKFITFEGSEGCGKSTQSKMLYRHLKTKGIRVMFLREPGGVRLSEKIRQILLDPHSVISDEAETLLYLAARAQVVRELIEPAVMKGITVICDRFLDSTLAYQGYGLGVDVDFIKIAGRFATRGLAPDLTILLDLPVKQGLRHRHATKDRIERRSLAYHERVRQGYKALARSSQGRIKVVKVACEKNDTQAAIRLVVDALFTR